MRQALLQVTLLGGMASCALWAQHPGLLVVNQGDSTVSVVDPATARPTASFAENTPGIHGHEIAVSPDGRSAYLPIYGSSGVGLPGISGRTMLVLDLPSRTITDKLDFGHEVRPHLPVVDAAHGLLYVTTELDQSVAVVDIKTLKVIGTVPTGQPESHMLAVSHDGRYGYTANVGPGTVSVLDLVGRKTLAVIPVGKPTQRISVSQDDRLVFTADQTTPRLAVIDAATRKLKQWIALPGTGYGTASTPDGHWLLVAVPNRALLAVVDLKSMQVTRTISLPPAPQAVLIRPDGLEAYVSCNTSGQVAQVSLRGEPKEWAVKKLIATGPEADGLAWVP